MNELSKPFSANIIDGLSMPQFVQLGNNLIAARFDLMKFTPAKYILDTALQDCQLRAGGHVIESSSGTFALALSILCSLYDLRLTLVTGPTSEIVRWRLENLGAVLHTVHASKNCEGGIQQARLNLLTDLHSSVPGSFWPQQYTNPLNSLSYRPVAERALVIQPKINAIVGTVGSGGSLFGIASVLKRRNPSLEVIAVDHNRSVIFGAQAKRISKMCRETFEQILAMGAGIPMGNVNFELCDEVHWVPVPKMVQKVHDLHQRTGMLVGPSSGAALAVAEWRAARDPSQNVLAILPDHGVRYVETLFNPGWLNNWNKDLIRQWGGPRDIASLEDVSEGWCRFKWGRRTYRDVARSDPAPRPAGYDP
ncbi:MAG: pyridoxal-phosphate dependent enzyme [Mesorhizobium sp.]|uniref:pyridoxal-phosphate dependent enzyme n=1 Tax=Mesorhizobium sp. TaxID=1871066 RepID=UPI000FE9F540|nr:pyridoxal-phosphate dependent enzyme [Mesorhizobium sp.]RWP57657.1 MAG: pyridoxal-phosphate dependent enzyme [Mesorhizobium sp.]TIW69484.1 MAG: pyridoxal-phosphate dependent enzyme [Mesorhizobium sp.]